MNFHVLLFIFLISFLVYNKKGPDYVIEKSAQVLGD